MTQEIAATWKVTSTLERLPSGEIFKAEHLRSGKSLTGRFLNSDQQIDQAAVSLLVSELKVLESDNPKRIAALIDAHLQENKLFLFYDCAFSNTLSSELEYRVLQFSEGIKLAQNVALALNELHAANVIHGRLTSESILLLSNSEVKLIDFALKPLWSELRREELPYLDPLLIENNSRTVRSDIYAFGILLYKLATGSMPFDISDKEGLKRRAQEIPPPLGKRASAWPAETFEIVKRCVSLDPNDRYISITKVYDALNRLAMNAGISSKSENRVSSKIRSGVSKKRIGVIIEPTPNRKTHPLWLLALFIIATFVGTYIYKPQIVKNSLQKVLAVMQPAKLDLTALPIGEYMGTIENFESLEAANLVMSKSDQKMLITFGKCSNISVAIESGYFFCHVDGLFELSTVSETELSGNMRIHGEDHFWRLHKVK